MADSETYTVEKKNDVAVLTLMLNAVTSEDNEDIKKVFTGLLDEGIKNIILDLSKTTFISSLVIASFVYMLKKAKEAGGNLMLSNVKDKVKEVLNITNLNKVFDIYETKEEALRKIGKK